MTAAKGKQSPERAVCIFVRQKKRGKHALFLTSQKRLPGFAEKSQGARSLRAPWRKQSREKLMRKRERALSTLRERRVGKSGSSMLEGEERTKKNSTSSLSHTTLTLSSSFCCSFALPPATHFNCLLFLQKRNITATKSTPFLLSNSPLQLGGKAAAELKLPLRRQRPPTLPLLRHCSRKRLCGPLSDEPRLLKGAQVAQAVIYLEPATR